MVSLAAEIRPDADLWVEMAALHARKGKPGHKKALECLRKAVDKGFTDPKELEQEAAFAELRDDPGYREIGDSPQRALQRPATERVRPRDERAPLPSYPARARRRRRGSATCAPECRWMGGRGRTSGPAGSRRPPSRSASPAAARPPPPRRRHREGGSAERRGYVSRSHYIGWLLAASSGKCGVGMSEPSRHAIQDVQADGRLLSGLWGSNCVTRLSRDLSRVTRVGRNHAVRSPLTFDQNVGTSLQLPTYWATLAL